MKFRYPVHLWQLFFFVDQLDLELLFYSTLFPLVLPALLLRDGDLGATLKWKQEC